MKYGLSAALAICFIAAAATADTPLDLTRDEFWERLYSGDTENLEAQLTSLIEADTSNPRYRRWRGLMYIVSGRPVEFTEDFISAIRLEDTSVEYINNYSWIVIEELTAFLSRYPDHLEARRARAPLSHEHAYEDYTAILQWDSANVSALIGRGRLTSSRADFDRAVTLEPRNAMVLLQRSQFLSGLGWRQESHRDLVNALALDSRILRQVLDEIDGALRWGPVDMALQLIEASLQVQPDHPALMERLIRARLQAGEFEDAKRILDRNPSVAASPAGVLLLGDYYFFASRFDSAAEIYQKAETKDFRLAAIALALGNPVVNRTYGYDHHEIKAFAEILERICGKPSVMYEAFLIDPTFSLADSDLVDALIFTDQRPEALAELNRMIEQDKENPDLRVRRAILSGPSATTLEDLNHALAAYPLHASIRVLRGAFYREVNQHDSALVDFSAALEVDSTQWQAVMNATRYAEGRYLDLITRYLPLTANAYRQLAWSYAALDNSDSAIAAFKKVIAIDPDIEAWLNLRDLYDAKGDSPAAARAALFGRDLDRAARGPLSQEDTLLLLVRHGEAAGYEEALQFYSNAIQIDSDYRPARLNRFSALSILERDSEARIDEDWFLEHGLESDVVFSIARSRMRRGDADGALAAFSFFEEEFDTKLREFALSFYGSPELLTYYLFRNPDDVEARVMRARIYLGLGLLDSAVLDAAHAWKYFVPREGIDFWSANQIYGNIFQVYLTSRRYDEAAAVMARMTWFGDIENMLESAVDYTDAARDSQLHLLVDSVIALSGETRLYTIRGKVRVLQCDPLNALSDFSRVLRGDPNDPDALFGRAEAFANLFEYEHALVDYDRHLNQAQWMGDKTRILFRMGLLHTLSGRDTVAETFFARHDASFEIPQDVISALFVAALRTRQGNETGARYLLEKVTVAAEDDSWVQSNPWIQSAALFLSGAADESEVLSNVALTNDTIVVAQMRSLIGLELSRRDDDLAIPHYEWAVTHGHPGSSGFVLAQHELRRIRLLQSRRFAPVFSRPH